MIIIAMMMDTLNTDRRTTMGESRLMIIAIVMMNERNATAVRVEATTKMGDRIIHAAVPRRSEAFTNNIITSTAMRILLPIIDGHATE